MALDWLGGRSRTRYRREYVDEKGKSGTVPPGFWASDAGLEALQPGLASLHDGRTTMTYQRVLAAYPDATVLGLTATPCRGDGRGLEASFRP